MAEEQARPGEGGASPPRLLSERLGPLPILQRFLDRLALSSLLERFVPTKDRRCALPYSKALLVLLRSLLIEREPIYRQQETVAVFAPELFGLTADEIVRLHDDQIGRALDRLFDADRGALLTEVLIQARTAFGVRLDELHNDSTSIAFTGQYLDAKGRSLRGRRAPFITYGYSKDHRPDLKQLLFVLTTSADGGIPTQFRCEAGNASDSRTHEETWDLLKEACGRSDFLYVADSKLCNHEAMEHIDRRGGRFVTVLPRSRIEDREFRRFIQAHEPAWETVRDRPHPRRRYGPRDRWWVVRAPIPSSEGWPVVWVFGSLLALRQEHSRRERIAAALEQLAALSARLTGPRRRRRARRWIQDRVDRIGRKYKVARYLRVRVLPAEEHRYRQVGPGRPGPNTRYRRQTKRLWKITWEIRDKVVAYDHKSDGMYPLLTNDRTLTPRQVFEAHKRQPTIEKRFEQAKTVFEIAPVFLKNEGRIEALFFVYFLVLLVQALLERDLRGAMAARGIPELPLYPEARRNRRPTAEQVLRLFSLLERHTLLQRDQPAHVFHPQLTELQNTVLDLLGISPFAYRT